MNWPFFGLVCRGHSWLWVWRPPGGVGTLFQSSLKYWDIVWNYRSLPPGLAPETQGALELKENKREQRKWRRRRRRKKKKERKKNEEDKPILCDPPCPLESPRPQRIEATPKVTQKWLLAFRWKCLKMWLSPKDSHIPSHFNCLGVRGVLGGTAGHNPFCTSVVARLPPPHLRPTRTWRHVAARF